MDINLLDAALGIVFFLLLIRGLLRGMLRELAGLVALVLGFFLSGKLYPQLSPYLGKYIGDAHLVSSLAYGLVFAAVLVSVSVIVFLLRRFMTLTFTVWIDHVLGGGVGALKGVLVCALALALLQHLVPDSPFLMESSVAPYMAQISSLVRAYLPDFL